VLAIKSVKGGVGNKVSEGVMSPGLVGGAGEVGWDG